MKKIEIYTLIKMRIVSQSANAQYNENGEEVAYWCKKRKDWILHKKFREFYPFDTDFSQPYSSKEEFQKIHPDWQNKIL